MAPAFGVALTGESTANLDAGLSGVTEPLPASVFSPGFFVAAAFGFAAVAEPAALFGSSAGFSGTDGKRSARISDARIVALMSFASGAFSTIFVITRTSSSRLRSAAGFTRMLRNRSLPGETSRTVPMGRPLGKMRSPPLVMIRSPGLI